MSTEADSGLGKVAVALGARSKDERARILGLSLMAACSTGRPVSAAYRRALAVAIANFAELQGGGADRRVRLLGLLAALALIRDRLGGQHSRRRGRQLLTERVLLGRLVQAHVRGVTARTQGADPDGQFDDVSVAVSSVGSVAWLAEHIAGDVQAGERHGLLYYLQGVADALAARAEELGVSLSLGLPAQQLVRRRRSEDEEIAYRYGVWDMDTDAGLELRRALVGAAGVLIEQWLQAGDELRFEPYYVRALSAGHKASAIVYVSWRAARSVQDDQPAAGYSVPGRSWGRQDGRVHVTRTGSRLRVAAAAALAPKLPSEKIAELRNLPAVEINSHAVLDLPLENKPSLSEFQAMLRGARIVIRASDTASAPLRAAEAYLTGVIGCFVEWLDASTVPARSPGTPGLSKHLVAQRPPAYVIIDDDAELLRTEFELLRGTLSFSSKSQVDAQARRGFYAATLGIIVLAPVRAVAAIRECVRALSAEPHALPPPVVRVVARPVGERRLLACLRAAWEARRWERHAVAAATPGRVFAGTPGIAVNEPALRTYSTHTTPLSSTSESLYYNVRTVGGSPGSGDGPAGLMTWPRTAVAPQTVPHEAALRVSTALEAAEPAPSAPVQTPPSPLIEVDSSLAKTLRC
ncbi:hypothetical protein H4S02_007908, partial [Coemansia sp. RSA 2611]